ncbi:MAG: phosphatidate cytidylyltransferase, partial [Coriobacteriia bacterium]|nr:phosphatidate cytidylyltransferase [Coriobacteriia bacterium]
SMAGRPTGPFSSLPVRIATGVLYGAVLVWVIYFGGHLLLAILMAALGALAVSELYRMTRRERRTLAELCGFVAVAAMPVVASFWGLSALFLVMTALVAASLVWHVYFVNLRIADTTLVVFGAAYIGFALAHFVLIRGLEDGVFLALAVLVGVWASDVLAYFVGSLIGSHKLAPRISPAKSWEGFVAGTLGTVGVWLALPLLVETTLTLSWRIVIGIALALAALVGDLFESRIKREVGVKDSGNLMPGHGGFLDRIDSLLLVSVIAYYLLLAGGIR